MHQIDAHTLDKNLYKLILQHFFTFELMSYWGTIGCFLTEISMKLVPCIVYTMANGLQTVPLFRGTLAISGTAFVKYYDSVSFSYCNLCFTILNVDFAPLN